MCGLCGFLSYDTSPIKDINDLTNELMESASVRGTDAAGIAFCRNGNVFISKEGRSAEKIDFKLPEAVKAKEFAIFSAISFAASAFACASAMIVLIRF